MNATSATKFSTVLASAPSFSPLIAQKAVEEYVAKLLTVSAAQTAFGFPDPTQCCILSRKGLPLFYSVGEPTNQPSIAIISFFEREIHRIIGVTFQGN